MKREELKKLLGEAGTDEVLDKIMAMNGQDIETHKNAATTAGNDLKAANEQLTAAKAQIKSFEDMKPEDLKKAVTDWETKYKDLEAKHAAEAEQRHFDTALEKGISAAKAKNHLTVLPLINREGLKYNPADGSLIGLKEQLEAIKKDEKNGYLFEVDENHEEPPAIVLGSEGKGLNIDKIAAAAMSGAGVKTGEK